MLWSFVTTVYNKAQWLAETFDSLAAQTTDDWEAVVVDDCSTDGSYEIALGYAAEDERFKVHQMKTNSGCGAACHRAIALAQGDLIGVVDADDLLYPNSARRVAEVYAANPGIAHLWTTHDNCREDSVPVKAQWTSGPTNDMLGIWGRCYSHWRTFRSSCRDVQDVVDPTIPNAVDRDMGFRLDECGPGLFLSEPLYVHRVAAGRMSDLHQFKQVIFHGVALERARVRRNLPTDALGRSYRNV
jgi:glycosyltransferase involved in cell wall biosynthesis